MALDNLQYTIPISYRKQLPDLPDSYFSRTRPGTKSRTYYLVDYLYADSGSYEALNLRETLEFLGRCESYIFQKLKESPNGPAIVTRRSDKRKYYMTTCIADIYDL